MFFNKDETNDEEVNIKENLNLQELLIRMDALDREVNALMSELKVTPSQVNAFVSNKENFTEENWQKLQATRLELDSKFSTETSNIRNVRQTEQRQKERHVQPH